MDLLFIFFFFFFQAEDGIRDGHVTGVQRVLFRSPGARESPTPRESHCRERRPARRHQYVRSEERRVGKECRFRWAACHEKKKKRASKRSLSSNDNTTRRSPVRYSGGCAQILPAHV